MAIQVFSSIFKGREKDLWEMTIDGEIDWTGNLLLDFSPPSLCALYIYISLSLALTFHWESRTINLLAPCVQLSHASRRARTHASRTGESSSDRYTKKKERQQAWKKEIKSTSTETLIHHSNTQEAQCTQRKTNQPGILAGQSSSSIRLL